MKNTTTTNRIMILAIIFILTAAVFTIACADAATEYSNTNDAASEVLDGLNAHDSTITVNYVSSSKDGNGIAKSIFNSAIKQSGMADYMEFGVYSKYSISWTAKSKGDGKYHFTINFKISYKMTASQTKAFEKNLDKTVDKLDLDGKSDKAKVKKIYNWITKNVKYDKKSKGNTKYTAYAALNKKKAVCQGYSLLFYRMCDEVGVDSNIITGISHNENHAWNIVKIGNKYRNVDSTWDAGKSQKNYKYFLKSDKKFRKDHKRSATYSTEAFYKAHPMAK